MIVLYKIKMSLEKKIRLGFLFSVGTMSCVGSALRQHYQVQKSADFMCKCIRGSNHYVSV